MPDNPTPAVPPDAEIDRKRKDTLYSMAYDAYHTVNSGGYLGGNRDAKLTAALDVLYAEVDALRAAVAQRDAEIARLNDAAFGVAYEAHTDGRIWGTRAFGGEDAKRFEDKMRRLMKASPRLPVTLQGGSANA